MNYIFDWFIMLGLAMLLPISFIIYRRQLLKKERESHIETIKAVYEAEEKQKQSIASDLHDEIIPMLSLIVQNVDLNAIDFSNGRFKIENTFDGKTIALSTMDSIKSIALDLTPKVLTDLGLINALNSYVKRIKSDVYCVNFENHSDFDEVLPFNKQNEINIYRTCLEIIKNLQKHEAFSQLLIVAANDSENLKISFGHDGKGITDKEIKEKADKSIGLGLKSINSRLLILNAKVQYSVSSVRSEVQFIIPMQK